MRIPRSLLGLALTAAAWTACGGDGGTDPDLCFLDEGQFRDLELLGGDPPSFTWCGAPANSMTVRRGGQTLWRIECLETGAPLCIDPPVAYGDSLDLTETTTAPQPLGPGSAELCLGGTEGRPAQACLNFTL